MIAHASDDSREGDRTGGHEPPVRRYFAFHLDETAHAADDADVSVEVHVGTRGRGELEWPERRDAQPKRRTAAGAVGTRCGETADLCDELHQYDRRDHRLTRKVPLEIPVRGRSAALRARLGTGNQLDDLLHEAHRRPVREPVEGTQHGGSILKRLSELVASFARLRRDQPSRPLVHLPALRRTWTAEALWERFEQTRDVFAASGIGRGDLIVARSGDAPTAMALLAATLARGATFAPCDRTTPVADVIALARRFGARATILEDDQAVATPITPARAPLPGGHTIRLHEPDPDAPARPTDIVMLKLTSGSTGAPRAVAVTEPQLLADSRRLMHGYGLGPDDVQMAAIPLSHAYGHGNLVVPALTQGIALVRRESFVPNKIVEDAHAYGATAFPGVPFMFEHLATHAPDGVWPSRLRTVLSAGAPLPIGTVRAFHARYGVKVHSFYGTSEGGGISYDDAEEIGDQVTQGRALDGVTVTLRVDGAVSPDGGRVHVASDAVGCGYLGESDADLADGGFLTGDLGRFDDKGRLLLLGRVSSFVNVAGRKVQPEEVEQVLRAMPGIGDARVVGAADPRRGEQLVACLVPTRTGLTALDVRRYCAERLAPHKIPHVWIFMDAIPLTERGKTDRGQLQSMVVEHLARA